jgi:hypothetical protein
MGTSASMRVWATLFIATVFMLRAIQVTPAMAVESAAFCVCTLRVTWSPTLRTYITIPASRTDPSSTTNRTCPRQERLGRGRLAMPARISPSLRPASARPASGG